MPDLVTFLTDRLDEIEYAGWHALDCQGFLAMPTGFPPLLGTHLSCNCAGPEWMIADVKAKRRIIRMVAWLDNYAHPGVHTLTDLPARLVLRELATPFVKHPDYQPEWGLPDDAHS